jgi:hypothetical protein
MGMAGFSPASWFAHAPPGLVNKSSRRIVFQCCYPLSENELLKAKLDNDQCDGSAAFYFLTIKSKFY